MCSFLCMKGDFVKGNQEKNEEWAYIQGSYENKTV